MYRRTAEPQFPLFVPEEPTGARPSAPSPSADRRSRAPKAETLVHHDVVKAEEHLRGFLALLDQLTAHLQKSVLENFEPHLDQEGLLLNIKVMDQLLRTMLLTLRSCESPEKLDNILHCLTCLQEIQRSLSLIKRRIEAPYKSLLARAGGPDEPSPFSAHDSQVFIILDSAQRTLLNLHTACLDISADFTALLRAS